jgi:uncharacterized protein YjbI with pentapeptide repeats
MLHTSSRREESRVDQEERRTQQEQSGGLWAAGIFFVAFVFLLIVLGGYVQDWEWTGFPKRSLWDWLDVLIVPAVLAIGGYWFAEQRAKSDRHIEVQRAQETALQALLDQITHSDTYSELRTAPASGHKRAAVRAKIQTLLLRLDEVRKGILLSSLHGVKLIRKKEITPYEYTKEESEKTGEERWRYPILSLNDIDFSRTELNPDTKLTFDDLRGIILRSAKLSRVNLSGANLRNADLRDADLSGAQLRKANQQDSERIPGEFHNEVDKAKDIGGRSASGLWKTDLSGANLSGAKLSRANLGEADLIGANLFNTNLIGADLNSATLIAADLREATLLRANLRKANVRGANLRGADLSGAKGRSNEELEQQAYSLEGATMPDGQKYEEWLKSEGRGEGGQNSGPS